MVRSGPRIASFATRSTFGMFQAHVPPCATISERLYCAGQPLLAQKYTLLKRKANLFPILVKEERAPVAAIVQPYSGKGSSGQRYRKFPIKASLSQCQMSSGGFSEIGDSWRICPRWPRA